MRSWGVSLLVCVLLGVAAPRADAQQTVHPGGVALGADGGELVRRQFMSLRVHAGYGGVYRPGYWTPVEVVVNARVPRDMREHVGDTVRGILRVTVRTSARVREIHETEVAVPVMGQQRYAFLVLPEADTVRVEFEPVRQAWLITSVVEAAVHPIVGVVRMRAANRNAVVVATLPGNDPALRRLQGRLPTGPLHVATVHETDMPGTAAGWFGVDALVLSLRELGGLPPAVQDAVLQWVRTGGRLALTYDGAGAQVSGDVARALPATLGLSRQVQANAALETFGGAPLPAGTRTFIAVAQTAPRGEVLLQVGGMPLITQRRLDSGTITLMGANLNASPFAGWAGLPAMWGALLPRHPQAESGKGAFRSAILNAYLGFHDVSAAGLSGVLLAFAVYAALLGVGLSFLLRRLGQTEWYWIAAGVIVAFVAAITVFNPATLSVESASVRTLSILRMRSGAAAGRLETYAVGSAHISSRIRMRLATRTGALRVFGEQGRFDAQEREFRVDHAQYLVAHNVAVGPTDAMVVLGTDTATDIPAVDFVHMGEGRFLIRNRTGFALTHVAAFVPGGFIQLHDLPAGSQRTLHVKGANAQFVSWKQEVQMQGLLRMFPALLGQLPQAVDIPGVLSRAVTSHKGPSWVGAPADEVSVVAWWPLASMAAGNADRLPAFHGHTLLVLTAEDA